VFLYVVEEKVIVAKGTMTRGLTGAVVSPIMNSRFQDGMN
jgi:hypothetical protein